MNSRTPPGYVLAAPVSETSGATWALRVYPVGTGDKVPLAAAVVHVGDSDVRQHLEDAARGLGWQRGGAVQSGQGKQDFYAWEAWPLPSPSVPSWADAEPAATWEPADDDSADLRVTHRRVVGAVDGVEVCVARTDHARVGVVSFGEVRVAVNETARGVTPAGADDLCGYVLEAARLAVQLSTAPHEVAPVVSVA